MEAHSEREVDEVRARQRDRERRRAGTSVREGTVVEGVRNRGWAKAEATREKKRSNETLGALATSTLRARTLEAILIPIGSGAWCAMMAVTPESQGLNSPSTEDQWGNFRAPWLKGFVVAAPLLSG